MLIGTKELRQRGYSDTLIRQLCHTKDSPFFRVGRKWRVHEADLTEFERRNKQCVR